MSKYGQYCPVARSLEILGDRWTLLIIRDMLLGTTQFNDLERGLPGISRALLSQRLRQLRHAGIIEKRLNPAGRKTTEYQLTQAGRDLQGVIFSLMNWGEAWAFDDPREEELDPILLMWWLRKRVDVSKLPQARVVVQFDFHGGQLGNTHRSAWLVMTQADVTLCLTDPGYEIDVLVSSHLTAFYKLWWNRISYSDALDCWGVTVEGTPALVRAFPDWYGWSPTPSREKSLA
ncbi:MAG TPA: helix-turn-helix domain-containing protein [Phototrophicaceae bacterium]|nr:helix-turn-helix domain-containing protein [Phototrophicaceae bacterium]